MSFHFTSEQLNHYDFWELSTTFQVPIYQRDYIWSEGNLDDLLFGFLNNTGNLNYLGEVLLEKTEAGLTILYGQQKLISIQLLGWAITQLLEEWIEAGQDISSNKQRVAKIQHIIGTPEQPKFRFNQHTNPFYHTYICKKGHPGALTRYKPVEQLLYRFYEYFLKRLKLQIVNSSLMDSLIQRILHESFIGITAVKRQRDAYDFLLSRLGTEPDISDLFKNHLLTILDQSRPDSLTKADQIWQQLSGQLNNFGFTEFIRLYWCSSRSYVRKQLFFDTFCSQSLSAGQVLEFLQELNIAMQNFSFYSYKKSANEKGYSFSHAFRTLRLYPTLPLLLAAKQHLNEEEFDKLVKDIISIGVRYCIICHRNPYELEQSCAEIALDIRNGKLSKAYDVFQCLRRFWVPDEIFTHDFAIWTIDTRTHADIAIWILTQIELYLNPNTTIQNVYLEHILPENPSFVWNLLFQHHTEEWMYRLGNLCLTEKYDSSWNEQNSFEEKVETFKQSNLVSTQKIGEYEDWKPTIITHRQRELAETACQIWRSGY